MKEKEIDQMNIEELRSALRESESARAVSEKALDEAKKKVDTYKNFWDMNEKENKQLKAKIEVIKAVASLF